MCIRDRERSLGQVPVTNLAAAGAAHGSYFTRRERREIVMEHERLGRLARIVDAVEALDIVGGAEGEGDERLCLPASEQSRTVRAWQYGCVDRDGPHVLCAAAINALAGVQH